MTPAGRNGTTLTYEGPTTIPCPQKCELPAGAKLTVVPEPRHAWSDVIRCPNEGCGLCFLVETSDG